MLHFLKEQEEVGVGDTSSSADNSCAGKEKEKGKNKLFTGLPDHELWAICKQVVSGVQYLHKQDIIHGDIKPQVITPFNIAFK